MGDSMKYSNQFRLNRAFIWLPILSVVLASCGGGGGDSGPPPETTAPTITVTSHTDGQEIIGARTITLQGTVSSDTQSVSILQNGGSIPATLSGDTFSADVTMADRDNTFEISATDAADNKGSTSITLNYPFLSFEDGQKASMVIGQPDFISGDVNRGNPMPSANSLNQPDGNMALDSSGNLYVPDSGNNRILVFSGIPSESDWDANATDVIGQPGFSSALTDTLWGPFGVNIDNDRLFIVDIGNNRILIWPVGGVQAEVVIGQQGSTGSDQCSINTLNEPYDVYVVENKVIVADTSNNRVLIWNEIPTKDGQDADVVLGQSGFDTCFANESEVSDAPPSAHSLNDPTGVWSDGTRLVVADALNNRVLIWNTFPTTGKDADIVLGQSLMTTNIGATTQEGLWGPYNIRSNKNQLFVTDVNNSRVLVWDTFPTQAHEPASRVLGFDNFTTETYPDASQTSLGGPAGLLVTGDKLLVADDYFNRFMIFQAPYQGFVQTH